MRAPTRCACQVFLVERLDAAAGEAMLHIKVRIALLLLANCVLPVHCVCGHALVASNSHAHARTAGRVFLAARR